MKHTHEIVKFPYTASLAAYICYQRTELLPNSRVFRRHPFYHIFVWLNAMFRKKTVVDRFGQIIREEFEELKPYLPRDMMSVLDVGCGVAGIDVYIARAGSKQMMVHLFDKTHIDIALHYGYQSTASFYNSMNIAGQVMELNRIRHVLHPAERGFPSILELGGTPNLVISLQAWGFHFPVEDYLKEVCAILADDGMIILDIRKGSGSKTLLEERFKVTQTIRSTKKYDRVLFHGKK